MRAVLVGLKGVKDADVSYDDKQATIQFDEKGDVSLNDLFKVLQNNGYQGSAL